MRTTPLVFLAVAIACATVPAAGRAAAAGPPATASAAGWSIQPTPNPANAINSFLNSVSCARASACLAVGDYRLPSQGGLPLAERWDGAAWSLQPPPLPAGAAGGDLTSVSCPAPAACTAAGAAFGAPGTATTLAEHWDGSRWVIQPTPNPAGAKVSFFQGVSCPAAGVCTAVGYYLNPANRAVPLAGQLRGGRWVLQAVPVPAGTWSGLSSVSCRRAWFCTAVGDNTLTSGTQVAVAEHWNGTRWAIQRVPAPRGALISLLSGVSCATMASCTATGTVFPASGNEGTLAEHWNGTRWAIQHTPNPPGSSMTFLVGVSCPTPSTCTTVGEWANDLGVGETLAEQRVNGRWVIQPTPNPAGSSSMFGVSCLRSTVCTGVGSTNEPGGELENTLAERR
jgi:hypothetical protein